MGYIGMNVFIFGIKNIRNKIHLFLQSALVKFFDCGFRYIDGKNLDGNHAFVTLTQPPIS